MPSFSPQASQEIPVVAVVYVLFVPYVPSLRADLGLRGQLNFVGGKLHSWRNFLDNFLEVSP